MPDEVELKLALRPRDAVILADSGLLGGEPRKVRQRSLYFDTADHSLLKAGLSLRIRRVGRKRIQTVKARGGSSAGLFARPEWESAVPGDTPVLDDTTPIQTLLGERADELAPVFEVRVERRIWDIREGETLIELVIDRGTVVAGDRRSSICEIELELKSGDAAALFAFARKLDAAVPLRLGVLTKAERGYALLDPAVAAVKAGGIDLPRDMTAAQALQQIVQACLRQFRLNEDLLLMGRAPEALHQSRVALRRLRSALSVFKALIADDASAGLREALRWLAATLGRARSIDVLVARAPAGALRDRLETARHDVYAQVVGILASARARGVMLDLVQWNMSGAWLGTVDTAELRDQRAGIFARAALDRLRRKVKRGGRDLADLDDQAARVPQGRQETALCSRVLRRPVRSQAAAPPVQAIHRGIGGAAGGIGNAQRSDDGARSPEPAWHRQFARHDGHALPGQPQEAARNRRRGPCGVGRCRSVLALRRTCPLARVPRVARLPAAMRFAVDRRVDAIARRNPAPDDGVPDAAPTGVRVQGKRRVSRNDGSIAPNRSGQGRPARRALPVRGRSPPGWQGCVGMRHQCWFRGFAPRSAHRVSRRRCGRRKRQP